MNRVGRVGLCVIGCMVQTIDIVLPTRPVQPTRSPVFSREYSDPFIFAREHAQKKIRDKSLVTISAQPRRCARVQKRPFVKHHFCEECYKARASMCTHKTSRRSVSKTVSAKKDVSRLWHVSSPRPRFSWPITRDRFWISDYYGTKRRGRLHAGIDLAALRGTPVYAAAPGVVEQARGAGGFGNMVLVRHNKQYHSRYAHLRKIATRIGRYVKRGSLIGYVGNSGRVAGKNGDHLHFEILSRDVPVNPIKYLTT